MEIKLPTNREEFDQEIQDSIKQNYAGVDNDFTRYAQAKTEREHLMKAFIKGKINYPEWLEDAMKELYDKAFVYYFRVTPDEAKKRIDNMNWPECQGHFDKLVENGIDDFEDQLREIAISMNLPSGARSIAYEVDEYYPEYFV
jgi:hypothetical protein